MSDLRTTFDQFDTERSGSIVARDLDALIRALGGDPRNAAAVEALGRLQAQAPGRVTFEEFRAWWEAHSVSTMKTAKVRAFRDPASDKDPSKASGT